MLDTSIVRVPRVYRHFMDSNDHGFIIMDLMEGVIKDSITESEKGCMTRILEHFVSIKSQKPGPLAGGPSRGFLFGESDYPIFESIQDMEAWFNVRLLDPKTKISFAGLDLVFCHLGLFPRNILWLELGQVDLPDSAHNYRSFIPLLAALETVFGRPPFRYEAVVVSRRSISEGCRR